MMGYAQYDKNAIRNLKATLGATPNPGMPVTTRGLWTIFVGNPELNLYLLRWHPKQANHGFSAPQISPACEQSPGLVHRDLSTDSCNRLLSLSSLLMSFVFNGTVVGRNPALFLRLVLYPHYFDGFILLRRISDFWTICNMSWLM